MSTIIGLLLLAFCALYYAWAMRTVINPSLRHLRKPIRITKARDGTGRVFFYVEFTAIWWRSWTAGINCRDEVLRRFDTRQDAIALLVRRRLDLLHQASDKARFKAANDLTIIDSEIITLP